MRKRPSILSEYRVRVSCQCIASVYSVRANIRDFKSVSFTLHPSVFGGLETAPSAPSGVNVVRGVARDVVRDVVRGVSRDVSRDVGRMRQYEHLTGAESPPLFYISHNLSVEMGDFTDKLLTFNQLVRENLPFYGQTGHFWSQPLSGLCESVSKQVDSQEHI